MSEAKHTPGPWRIAENEWNVKDAPWRDAVLVEGDVDSSLAVPPLVCATYRGGQERTNARLISAAPDLLEAAQLLEAAELCRQDCEECQDEGEPEACGTCFPKFDDARIKRRIAIAKALGGKIG